jgi:uncharacterized protein (TIGR00369 family)
VSQPTATELVTQWLSGSPFVGHLGMKLVRIDDGRAEVVLPYHERMTTLGDVVHGGAIAALIDSAATAACWAGAPVPDGMRGTTVSITVTYIAAGRASDLTATANVVRRGKSLCYAEVAVTDGAGEVVAKALVTYKLG